MFKFFKKYFIATILIIVAAALVMAKPFQTPNASDTTLVIGLQSGYPPFEFMNDQGKIIGFDVDVAKRIAESLGKTLVIKDMEFEGEILSLKQEKIDLILSGMNITPSRLKEISMVPYHGEAANSLSLIFWNKIPEGVQAIEDLAHLPHGTVSVESGAIPEAHMARYKDIPVKSFQGALAPLMDVKYGKSIANLVEPDVATYLQRQHPEIKILNVPVGSEESILGFGIGIKKENGELFQQVQQIIDDLKVSGELKQLEEKWFKGGQIMSLLVKSLPFLIEGAFDTLQIALVAIAVGLCGGLLVGILNSDKLRTPFSALVLSSCVWVVRGTPLFVQVLIVYYALPEILGLSLSPFTAGVIALGVNSMAYISEIVRGGINALPAGQWEAAHVIGLNHAQTLRGIILPQVFRHALPSLTNELTSLIKETSILMVIGVAELTKVSKDIVARELDPMTIYLAAAALYLVMTSSVSLLTQLSKKRYHA